MKRYPDPVRAHGVWVFLSLSVLAGSLSAAGAGFRPALLAGLGFAGAFLAASALAIGWKRGRRRLFIGIGCASLAPAASLLMGARPTFFLYGIVALGPALLSAWFSSKRGVQSPLALAMGVCAIAVAAPSAACAGGATIPRSLVLLAMLLPFFVWRSLLIRARLPEYSGGGRQALRRVGQREAVFATLWTAAAVFAIHLLPF